MVTPTVSVEGSASKNSVEFLIVENLVVPVFLGTPWIDRYVRCIDPKSRSVEIDWGTDEQPFEVTLRPSPIRNDGVVAVGQAFMLLPF